MTAFFVWHRKHRVIYLRTKIRNKIFFNIAVEKLKKKTICQVGALERDFSKPIISRFWVQILEIG